MPGIRQRYLNTLRLKSADGWVWAPNFDYWLAYHSRAGTLPPKYRGLSRNDIARAIGGAIWNRSYCLKTILDPSVTVHNYKTPDGHAIEYQTPVGTIREAWQKAENEFASPFQCEHKLKSPADFPAVQYLAEATHYQGNPEAAQHALTETADDGIVLMMGRCVPFIQFAKTDVGYLNAYYLLQDEPDRVERLLTAYTHSFLQAYQEAARLPIDIIATDDNMDGRTLSPTLFKRYAIPFYQSAQKIAHAGGKLFQGHWCGHTEMLLEHVPGSGLDVVEAAVSQPMASITLPEILNRLHGEVALQGGIPSVLVCPQGGTHADFERYISETILPLKGRRGFVLGMSDNVPPNADFSRIESVSALLQ
ncbi:MAG: uroporphyrinogen decarboxylase family protein [Phycisphaerales bacterium]|nr:uroporphyrinogen decarboxylase family protein [Phycisphaerales bacterium]